MSESLDIEIENPLPFVDTDPRKVARGFEIRQSAIDRSPSALHQHYQAMIDEEISKRLKLADELAAAKVRESEAQAAAIIATVKAKAEAQEQVLSAQQRLTTAMEVVEKQQITAAFVAMQDRSDLYTKLRQPAERELSGGELVAQSYQKTVDGLIEVMKSPAAQKTLSGLLGSLAGKFAGAQSPAAEAGETRSETEQAAPSGQTSRIADLASLPLSELAALMQALPEEKIVDEYGNRIKAEQLRLTDLIRILSEHYGA